MKTIKNIHEAVDSPIDNLKTYRALPTNSISMEVLNPFIFLNHHGPQKYSPNNNGLPFGPHPHRGMETVTFIIAGDIMHRDSNGYKSVINAGGIQWMTAGRGLIHSENSSDKFKKNGGDLEILQLWLNLPSKFKMIDPFYKGLQKEEIPEVKLDENRVKFNLISGKWEIANGAFQSVSDVNISTINFYKEGRITIRIPSGNNIFFYVIKGELSVNQNKVKAFQLAEFNNDGDELNIEALDESILLLGYSKPLDEPIVAQGPFVMNSDQEIVEAYSDYRNGKFGNWQE